MAGKNGNRRRNSRRRRRDEFHSDSHADPASLSPIPDIEGVPNNEAEPITSLPEMIEACDRLRASGRIAYDTEFIGEETYWPQLCLIQLASTDEVVLIDPQAIEDMSPVWELLADDAVEVIVHAGKTDLDIATVASGTSPTCVRDTQVLAGFAGLPWPVGLNKCIGAVLGVKVPGGMTFTAWNRRPLSPQQCRYAADDVRYLLMLEARLQARIVENDLEPWALAAQAERCTGSTGQPDMHAQRRRIENGRSLRKGQRATLQALVEARDSIAQELDRPHRAVIPDQALLAAARQRPDSASALNALRGMPRPVVERFGKRLIGVIADSADAEPPADPPRPTEGCPYQRVAIDALWHRFAAICMDRGLAPELVATRTDLARWHLGGGGDWPVDGWREDALDALLGTHLKGATVSLAPWPQWQHEAAE
ncbi:MAG: HRDC domain-containing protein [Phycisphaerales bacterium]|nr:HRDC domain-containing protein [Phycisphaerales bacterium]